MKDDTTTSKSTKEALENKVDDKNLMIENKESDLHSFSEKYLTFGSYTILLVLVEE